MVHKARCGQIQSIDEGFNELDGVLGADLIIKRFRQKQRLSAVVTGNVRHDPKSQLDFASFREVSWAGRR